jgi:hypothetical protein
MRDVVDRAWFGGTTGQPVGAVDAGSLASVFGLTSAAAICAPSGLSVPSALRMRSRRLSTCPTEPSSGRAGEPGPSVVRHVVSRYSGVTAISRFRDSGSGFLLWSGEGSRAVVVRVSGRAEPVCGRDSGAAPGDRRGARRPRRRLRSVDDDCLPPRLSSSASWCARSATLGRGECAIRPQVACFGRYGRRRIPAPDC